jgi:hypothetical protein
MLPVDSRYTLLILWEQTCARGVLHLREEIETCSITQLPYTVYCTFIIPSIKTRIKDGEGGSGVLVPALL